MFRGCLSARSALDASVFSVAPQVFQVYQQPTPVAARSPLFEEEEEEPAKRKEGPETGVGLVRPKLLFLDEQKMAHHVNLARAVRPRQDLKILSVRLDMEYLSPTQGMMQRYRIQAKKARGDCPLSSSMFIDVAKCDIAPEEEIHAGLANSKRTIEEVLPSEGSMVTALVGRSRAILSWEPVSDAVLADIVVDETLHKVLAKVFIDSPMKRNFSVQDICAVGQWSSEFIRGVDREETAASA